MPVLRPKMLPPIVDCPHCGASMTLDDQERIEKKFDCPACNSAIDFTSHAEVQSSSSFKKEQPQEASTTPNESSHKDEETFCCSDCGGSITYGDLTCSKCGAVLEYEENQDEPPELNVEKNDKLIPLASRDTISSEETESSLSSAGNTQTLIPAETKKMSLHGDYDESKSHRFFVRLFGALGFVLACYLIIIFVGGLVSYFGDPFFQLAFMSIVGTAAFIYLRHEWRESKHLEREWEEGATEDQRRGQK